MQPAGGRTAITLFLSSGGEGGGSAVGVTEASCVDPISHVLWCGVAGRSVHSVGSFGVRYGQVLHTQVHDSQSVRHGTRWLVGTRSILAPVSVYELIIN